MKRILTTLLCMCILASAFPAVIASAANEPAEPVMSEGIYQIGTAAELMWLSQEVGAGNTLLHAELTADIDLTGWSWKPIGASTLNSYKGVFDGNGHTISGLRISNSSQYQGLFGSVSGAVIRNMTLYVSIVSAGYSGGLVGNAANSTLEDVTVNGSISGSSTNTENIGGLAGYASGCVITRCTNNASVTGGTTVGGIVGYYSGRNEIRWCANTGAITATSSASSGSIVYKYAAGGLIGYLGSSSGVSYGEVSYCYSTGAVSGSTVYMGGLIGSVYYNTVMVQNCYSTGNVSSTRTDAAKLAHVGGFVGYTAGSGSARYAFNYSAGKVTSIGPGALAGGFGGTVTSVVESRYNYWLNTSAASATGNGLNIGAGAVYIAQFSDGSDLAAELSGATHAYGSTVCTSSFVPSQNHLNNGLPLLAWQICGQEHRFEVYSIMPACTEKGYVRQQCSDCGYAINLQELAAVGHSPDAGTVFLAPTCYAEGIFIYTCTVCHETADEAIPKTAHTFDAGTVTTPTCVEQGHTTYTCTVSGCGYSYDGAFTPMAGHSYDSERVEPACTEPGSVEYTCTVCDEDTDGHFYTEVVPPTGHNFVDGVCSNEDCGETLINVGYWLKLSLSPAASANTAAVSVTYADGTEVSPDAQTGRYLLALAGTYQYRVAAEHYKDAAGNITGVSESWISDEAGEDGVACYTMTIAMLPATSTAVFKGHGFSAVVNGEKVTETEVDYESDLEFGLEAVEGYWVSKVTIITEDLTQCDDVWNGMVSTRFGGGRGTAAEPYLIRNCSELAFLAQEVNFGEAYDGRYFRLEANLDLNNLPWDGIGRTAGLVSYVFKGNFDGNGHVICNLNTSFGIAGEYGFGLFGSIDSAVVKNLGISRCNVYAAGRTGALAAKVTNSVIENCWTTGTVTTAGYAGGLAAIVYNNSTIINCWSGATVENTSRTGGYAGGLVAYAYNGATITDCWNIGSVTSGSTNARVGGLVGQLSQDTLLKNCYNRGDITSSGTFTATSDSGSNIFGAGGLVGGLISSTASKTAIISGCYNSGTVMSAASRAGGLVGNLFSSTGTAYAEVSACYNKGAVVMLDSLGYAGGLIGRVGGSSAASVVVKNNYSTGGVQGTRAAALVSLLSSATVDNCYSREGTGTALFLSVTGTTTVANGRFCTEQEMQTGEFIVQLNRGTGFTDDVSWGNDGFPVFLWEAERPQIFGEYRQLDFSHDEESGLYSVPHIIQPLEIRVEVCTNVFGKNITFDVQPAGVVAHSLQIVVLDSRNAQVEPMAGKPNVFRLTVGETYSYIVTADDFASVKGILAVTEASSYLVSIRMDEIIPTRTVSFELNRQSAQVYDSRNDRELGNSVKVTQGGLAEFYILSNGSYEVASVYMSGTGAALDVWDGYSEDVSWYKSNMLDYTITTAAELAGLNRLVRNGSTDFSGVTFYLDADLDMTAASFHPIGYVSFYSSGDLQGYPFRGTFNGNGHTITANISSSDGRGAYREIYIGLFGYLDNAVVENVTFSGTVRASHSLAGIAGLASHSTLRGCVNLAEIVAIRGGGAAGILAYDHNSSQILNCYNSGNITGETGVAGILTSSSSSGDGTLIRGCQNAGTLTATLSEHAIGCGGIAISRNVILDSCSNSGTIRSNASWNGGLVADGAKKITNCYNVGNIYCTKSSGIYISSNYLGGLMGGASVNMVMENCYNAGRIYYTNGGSGTTGAVVGVMTSGSPSFYLNNYWLTGTWRQPIGTHGGVVINYSERQFKEVSDAELAELYSALGDNNWKKDLTGVNNGFPILRETPDRSGFCVLEDLGSDMYQIPTVSKNVTVYITLAKPLDSLTLDQTEMTLTAGNSAGLTPVPTGEEAGLWSIKWSSSDNAVATVNSSGVVSAVGEGAAVITASAGSKFAVCAVRVEAAETYAVTFAGGEGAEGAAPTTEPHIEGAVCILPENPFVKTGYAFIGWNDGKLVYSAGAEYIMPGRAVAFTAEWSKTTSNSTVTETKVSDKISVSYISGVENGMTSGTVISFTVTVDDVLKQTPIVFCAVGEGELQQLLTDENGFYTLTEVMEAVQICIYILGDVTYDGVVNAADALLILNWNRENTDSILSLCADVTRDGLVNAADALQIIRFSSRLIDTL